MKLLIANIMLGMIGMFYPLHIIAVGLTYAPFPVDVQILKECVVQASLSVFCLVVLIILNILEINKRINVR